MKHTLKSLALAGVLLSVSVLSEISGYSKKAAENYIARQRQELVNMLEKPQYSTPYARLLNGGNKQDIQENISFIDKYRNIMEESARAGLNVGSGLMILAGALGTIVTKRKLDEIIHQP